MVQAYSWHMALIHSATGATPFPGEIMVYGIKGRVSSPSFGWPTHGNCPYFDVDVSGELESTTDYDIVWEHWTQDTGPGTRGLTQAVMKDMANAAKTYVNAIKTLQSNQYALTEIRIQANNNIGKSVGGSNKFILKTPVAGSGSASHLPVNVAACVSTDSDSPTRRGHGRAYVGGLLSSGLSTGGLFGSSFRTTLSQQFAGMLDSIRATNQAVPAIVRQADNTFWDITSVRVGDEPDVMNSRRNKRPETYTKANLVP